MRRGFSLLLSCEAKALSGFGHLCERIDTGLEQSEGWRADQVIEKERGWESH